MEENSSIGFWKIAVGILVAAILIGVVFLIARQGKSVANEKLASVSNLLAEYQDETYTIYGGMEVSGAEVKNLIERAISRDDSVCIRVFTKASPTSGTDYVINATAALSEKTFDAIGTASGQRVLEENKNASTYINPSAMFKGTVCRNANEALVGVVFVQK